MRYVGNELELFAQASNWKRYFTAQLRPYVQGHVLDVGCGMGANAEYVLGPDVLSYTLLEPDGDLLAHVDQYVSSPLLKRAERIRGTTTDLVGRTFDTILYLDVIEHIEDSKAELQRAYDLLAPGGHLVIVVPAFNFLFSAFDTAIGHHRRYDKKMLRDELPPTMVRIKTRYLDSLGMLLSLGNRFFLKQNTPTHAQIRSWDRFVIPVSKITDTLFLHSFGRSLVAISRKPG